jgi:hypothetical protein
MRRRQDVLSRHPRLGRFILAASDDPHSTTAWAKGAQGERRLGASPDVLSARGAVVLHDRRVPKTPANIDHIVVAPSGVWVIDAKHYTGRVTKRDVGPWLRSDERLFVGGRDRSSLIAGLMKQVDVVTASVPFDSGVRVRPVLCFVDAEWKLFAKPFVVRNTLVTWPKALIGLISTSNPCLQQVEQIAASIAHALPPA